MKRYRSRHCQRSRSTADQELATKRYVSNGGRQRPCSPNAQNVGNAKEIINNQQKRDIAPRFYLHYFPVYSPLFHSLTPRFFPNFSPLPIFLPFPSLHHHSIYIWYCSIYLLLWRRIYALSFLYISALKSETSKICSTQQVSNKSESPRVAKQRALTLP